VYHTPPDSGDGQHKSRDLKGRFDTAWWLVGASPQRGSKPSFGIAWMCTARRRIPAIASTNQGTEKGDLIAVGARPAGSGACRRRLPGQRKNNLKGFNNFCL